MTQAVGSDEDIGRRVVETGALQLLRDSLGLSRRVMAEYLHVSFPTYARWEDVTSTQLRQETAARVGRFYQAALRELAILEDEAIQLRELMPLHEAARVLGIPQEVLLRRHRSGEFEGEDLGILGLWLRRSDVERM